MVWRFNPFAMLFIELAVKIAAKHEKFRFYCKMALIAIWLPLKLTPWAAGACPEPQSVRKSDRNG
jgi:hypothetical protein